jgi:disulfide bond formation protein DsbB
MNVEAVNLFFAFLSFAALAVAVAVPFAVLVARRQPDGAVALLLDDVRPLALWLAFAVAAVATGGSLYYSEVQNFTPCLLCWYQRIAMYPLALILGIAAFRGDHRIKVYAIPAAAIGAVISTYHYQLEVFPDQSSGVCDVAVPCTSRWFEVFGFVSLAFMALTGFLAIIALLSIAGPRPDDAPAADTDTDI